MYNQVVKINSISGFSYYEVDDVVLRKISLLKAYNEIKNFHEQIVTKEKEKVVLKKI